MSDQTNVHDALIGLNTDEISIVKRMNKAMVAMPSFVTLIPMLDEKEQTLDFSRMNRNDCAHWLGMLERALEEKMPNINNNNLNGIIVKSTPVVNEHLKNTTD